MTEAYWSWAASPWRIGAGAVLLGVSLWLSARQVQRGGWRRAEAGAEALRMIGLVLLALTLLRPERVRVDRETVQPTLAVLIDATGSMATRDVSAPGGGAPISRAEWVETLRAEPAWTGLSDRYRIREIEFGRDAKGTDLHAALDAWARRPMAARAVLMVGDGDWTLDPSPIEAASRLREQETPVFALAVGSDRFMPDIELLPPHAPAYAPLGERLHLPFVLRSRMPDPAEVNVLLIEDGIERARRNVFLPAMGQTPSSIGFVPIREGERTYLLRAEPLPGEARTDNNEQTFRIAVRREIIRMLIVETTPRWEYRYLRNAARRDPGVEAHTILFHPRLPPGGGAGYLSAFPETREALARYDVVFLGDVAMGEGGLTEPQCQALRDLVESQAAGLVFLPGPSGRWHSLAAGPLGALLPVDLEADSARGHGTAQPGGLALTMLGRDHRLTRLTDVVERNERLWTQLPGFHWYAGVARARPGSETLAVHRQARNADGRIPMIVTQSFGSGHVLFMSHDSAWRWRRGVEDLYHYRFWSQVFRWMSHRRHLARGEGMRFFFQPETPAVGDRLDVQATPLDEQGFPMERATVEAVLTGPSGEPAPFMLAEIEGGWGTYRGVATVRESGAHTLAVRCRDTGRAADTVLYASEPDFEPVGRPARREVLRELAALTGGRSGDEAEAESVLRALRDWPPRPPRETRFRLWAHPLWLATLAGVFSLYWLTRKMLGRI